jgi:hypothetical protein
VSAPALRRPARWPDAARAHLAASAPSALLGLAALVALTWPGRMNVPSARDIPFVEARDTVIWMIFLPLLHWRGRGSARALDQGLPMDDVHQEWLRTACGALWTVLTVGAMLAAHAVADANLRSGRMTYVPGLPVSILAGALGAYLVGAAVLVRSDRPGRALLLTLLALAVLGTMGEPLTRSLMSSHSLTEYLADVKHVSVPGWLRATLLPLVLGVGAVWASGMLGRHGHVLTRVRGRWMSVGRRPRSVPRTRPARVVAGPRHAAAFGAAVPRQFLMLRSRLGWSTLLVVGVCVAMFLRLPLAASSIVEFSVGLAASFWPALVWLEERGRRRDWDESVPVGRLPLRLAHALAGMAWLMVAAIPGALIHPAGIAVPAAALATYLASTAAAALLDRPVLGCFLAAFGTGIAGFSIAPEHPLSLARALAPLDTPNGVSWSPAASLLWLTLLAAAAVAALHWQAHRDRIGRTWLPRLRRAPQPA